MKQVRPVVVWNSRALRTYENIIDQIGQDSIGNAERVNDKIVNTIEGLVNWPARYAVDRHKKNNRHMVRAFEKCSIRITYYVVRNAIVIIRVRHVRQKPTSY